MATTMRAARPGERSRRPKTFDAGRVCRSEECDTIVSRYNQDDFCHRHRPRRYPRLRGVFTDGYTRD
jgi:hypothetical protein